MVEVEFIHQEIANSNADHAPIGPSAAGRWLACPASLGLTLHGAGYLAGTVGAAGLTPTAPAEYRPGGDAAIAGQMLHSAMENWLRHGAEPDESFYDSISEFISTDIASSVFAATKRHIGRLLSEYDIAHLGVEMRARPGLAVAAIDPILAAAGVGDHFWGTADIVGISRDRRTLLVADLKTGRHAVGVKLNDQMLSYAAGALHEFGATLTRDIETVVLAIIQPRIPGELFIDVIPVATLAEFTTYCAERLRLVARPARGALVEGDHCRWCPSAALCPIQQVAAFR